MTNEWEVIVRMIAALCAGGAIGLERSYHGRAAGLRTYALVCFGSALLVAASEYALAPDERGSGVTRVIQGIVTGVGFLGAGVIVKDGFSVRGLTTAASVWVASAIGIAIGTGAYLTGAIAAGVTLVALALLRRLEDRFPAQSFAHFEVAFPRAQALSEAELLALVRSHGLEARDISYALDDARQLLEYSTVIWTRKPEALASLEQALLRQPGVARFRIAPSRD
jgi:putative Mg2+ transporter-C (MgtC) family protein